jgi:hypothetical protein
MGCVCVNCDKVVENVVRICGVQFHGSYLPGCLAAINLRIAVTWDELFESDLSVGSREISLGRRHVTPMAMHAIAIECSANTIGVTILSAHLPGGCHHIILVLNAAINGVISIRLLLLVVPDVK